MVLDQLQELYKEEEDEQQHQDQHTDDKTAQEDNASQKESTHRASKNKPGNKIYLEQRIKKKLEREVNRLIYNKESDQIVESQELFQQEMINKMKMVDMDDDLGRFTSQHHMAIEAAIRKIKMILEA